MSDTTTAAPAPTTTAPPPRAASAPPATPTSAPASTAPRPVLAASAPAPLVSAADAQQFAGTAMALSTQVLSAPPNSEYPWIKPAVAILTILLLGLLTGYAFWSNDPTLKAVVATTIVLMAKNSQTFYFGSSSGSARKTDLLAAAPSINQGSST